ncbi:MAG: ribosome maturation factor RimP [Peptostreptococcales bacterium]
MGKNKVVQETEGILESYLKDSEYSLFNIEYIKEGKDWVLRVYIDKEEGSMGLEDCEKVSSFLSKALDEKDLIDRQYTLEVSSPGIDRPLLKESDYVKYAGKDIDIFLYKAIDGHKIITGKLKGLEDNEIIIFNAKGLEEKVHRELVSQVRLAVIF